ncbi:hypothetical protein SNE40_023660 [Patella caerulea]|uniref:Uncharacterized protein n=1 Tax=Patella caerulea TaxID=87958 RepID=A0AAN8GA95_PATCE
MDSVYVWLKQPGGIVRFQKITVSQTHAMPMESVMKRKKATYVNVLVTFLVQIATSILWSCTTVTYNSCVQRGFKLNYTYTETGDARRIM